MLRASMQLRRGFGGLVGQYAFPMLLTGALIVPAGLANNTMIGYVNESVQKGIPPLFPSPLQTITKAPSHSTNRMCSRPLIWCSFRCLMTRGMFKGRWWRWGLRAATVPLQVGAMKHTAYNGVHVRHWIRDEDVRVRHHSN